MWKRQKDDNTFEEGSCEEDPVILESEVKATLKVLGRNKPGRWDTNRIIQATETDSVIILTRYVNNYRKPSNGLQTGNVQNAS